MKEYIDKEKLLQEYWKTNLYMLSNHFEKIIQDMPSEDVAPVVHGKWNGYTRSAFHGCDEFGDPIYRDVAIYICPECGRRTVIKENYCPKCGAKMDLED